MVQKKGRGWHGEHLRHSLAARGRRVSKYYGDAPQKDENRRSLSGYLTSQTLEDGAFFYRAHGDAFVMESGHATEKAAKRRAELLRKDGWSASVLPNGETVVVKVNEVAIVRNNVEDNLRLWQKAQRSHEAETGYGLQRRRETEAGYMRALRRLYDLRGQKAGEQDLARIKRRM